MARRAEYSEQLLRAKDQIAFLRRGSNLPGPRANLELVQAAADAGDERAFHAWIKAAKGTDPTDEFLVLCAVVGLGRLAAQGETRLLDELRQRATDARWRVREGVAMGLQRMGERDMRALFAVAEDWAEDRPYVQRAAVAAVCEPRLLRAPAAGRRAVELVDRVTMSLVSRADRRSEEVRTLRQALGYCWSVAIAANPERGRRAFAPWMRSTDPDVAWVVRENLKKARLRPIIR